MRKKTINKLIMLLVAAAMLASPMSVVQAEEENTVFASSEVLVNSWEGSLQEGNRAYYGADGQRVAGLQQIGGVTYFFNADGILQTGWQTVNGKAYYFDLSDGSRYENKKEIIAGVEYDFDSSGNAVEVETDQPRDSEQEEDTVVDPVKNNPVTDTETAKDDKQQLPPEDNGSNQESAAQRNVPVMKDSKHALASTEVTIQTGWQNTDDGKKYLDSNGNEVTGFQTISGRLYYFNTAGILQYGWITEGEKKYFAAADGTLYRNQFIKFGTNQYYMGSDGSVQKGVVKASDGNIYYANPDSGILRKTAGWIDTEDGRRYFSDAAGKLYKNQFISFGTIQYYMGSDGSVQKEIIKAGDGNIYYADPTSGVIQKKAGWIDGSDGKKYFSNAAGKLYKNQFISFGTIQYYMGSDGSVQKGVVSAGNGNLYYADPGTGQIRKSAGWLDIGDKRYFCDTAGKLYKNQYISFGATQYYMGSDGSVQKGIVKASDGNIYYADPTSGVIQKKVGWIDGPDGKKYFSDAAGKLYKNQFISFGTTQYYMGSDGSVQKGVISASNGNLYYADPGTGQIRKSAGWLDVGDKRYFSDAAGKFYRNQIISFGTTQYYMGSDGSVQKGIVKASDGNIYYADPDSGVIQRKAGWLDVGDKRYFSDAAGKLYKNQFISFGTTQYYMGSDGSVQKGIVSASNGNSYYTDLVTGILRKQAGWINGPGGKKYFSDAAGKLYKNQFISFGNTYYYCGSDAAIVQNSSNYPIAGVLYTFGADGVMKKEAGWGEYKGNKYYKNPVTGFPYKNQWISFGATTRYYANASGFMVSGWQNIGGKYYYFYPSTKIMARNTTIDGYIIGADGARVPTALSKMAARAWGYSSSTPYLILVDRDAHKVGIFTGSKGNWTNIKFWDCANGAPSTPTKAGVFKVGIKGYYFDSGASRCFWYTQFYGNYLFHTILCNKDGSIRDGRVGMALSHGCVRLQIPNAKWIYDNIPKNTTVVIY